MGFSEVRGWGDERKKEGYEKRGRRVAVSEMRLILRSRQKDIQKLRAFSGVQASGNATPNHLEFRNIYAETLVADHGNEDIGASNAVKVCGNGDTKGAEGSGWGGVKGGTNGVESAGDGDVQMADDREIIVLD